MPKIFIPETHSKSLMKVFSFTRIPAGWTWRRGNFIHCSNVLFKSVFYDVLSDNILLCIYQMDVQPIESYGHSNSTCPQAEVKDHSASVGVTCDQHVESSSCCWLSRTGLPLHIKKDPNSSRCWIGIDPINWQKIPPHEG